MKPTLLILAAGMGSRYGGLKQLDGLGPNGETIMDYSVFDAVRAGFGKVVFVIREDFADDFRRIVLAKYKGQVDCEVCYQALDKIPAPFSVPEGRTKPWGTNHAVMMARNIINEPFMVINSDDFYGRESYEVMAKFLHSVEGKKGEYAMAGYRVLNTLSENGSVNRGICKTDADGYLTDVVERINIEEIDGVVSFPDEHAGRVAIDPNAPVSMNMWGFTPDYFAQSEKGFRSFLEEHGQEMKSEFYIPTMVNELIINKEARCKVLDTPSKWFGVTYAQDRPAVVMKLNELIQKGEYPNKLF
ncbi:MAG: nucleotidyltransferase [Paludibacteraceae bacterium]|nr:nucleotidyltransferase [Paludibacteraceae bacterium]